MGDNLETVSGTLFSSLAAILCVRQGHTLAPDEVCDGCVAILRLLREPLAMCMHEAVTQGILRGPHGDPGEGLQDAMLVCDSVMEEVRKDDVAAMGALDED